MHLHYLETPTLSTTDDDSFGVDNTDADAVYAEC